MGSQPTSPQPAPPPIIALTTDFGTRDPFVGLMKGVILSIAPDARLIDLSHAVPPQDVVAGALVLEAALGVLPCGTIHLAVVDPGVGSERSAVAVRTDVCTLVGPDNGLFSAVLRRVPMVQAVRLDNPQYHRSTVSATFHGRDIFAPAAAHLAAGVALEELGTPMRNLTLIALPEPEDDGDALRLHVVSIDHFGNLITDLTGPRYQYWKRDASDAGVRVAIAGRTIPGLSRTFSDVPPGELVAYFGSLNRLEIAVRNGSAAQVLEATAGTTLRLYRV